MVRRIAAAAVCILVSACGLGPNQTALDETAPDMSELSARTMPVARAVHFAVLSGQFGDDVQGDELLQRAIASDASLGAVLAGYSVHAQRLGAASAVLVCDSAGQYALVEDAGCTQHVDAELWRNGSKSPCRFSLPLASVCR